MRSQGAPRDAVRARRGPTYLSWPRSSYPNTGELLQVLSAGLLGGIWKINVPRIVYWKQRGRRFHVMNSDLEQKLLHVN